MNKKQITIITIEIILVILLILWMDWISKEYKVKNNRLEFLHSYLVALIENKPDYEVLKKQYFEQAENKGIARFNLDVYEKYKADDKIDTLKSTFNSFDEVIPRNERDMYLGCRSFLKLFLPFSILFSLVMVLALNNGRI